MITLRITRLLLQLSLAVGLLAGSAFAHAQSNEDEPIGQAELEQILAPIALYPDSILSHILVASTYPLEVVQAERWSSRNPELQGQEAVEAAEGEGWDPSVQALVAFPKILQRMSEELDWTQRLGEAFLQDEALVLSSVQTLRELAAEAGSLDEMDKVTVTRDKQIIIIEPREREVVYVPYYDTRSVYGHWRWRNHQPVYWDYPYAASPYYDDYYSHNRHSAFFWGPRISLSFGFFTNSFHWRNSHLVRISSHHYRPHRYYNHYDILGHHNAVRWVHNPRRGGGKRHPIRRDQRSDRNIVDVPRQGNVPIPRNQSRHQPRQADVRDQLANRRLSSPNVRSGSTRVDRSRAQQNGAVTRNNSRVINSGARPAVNSRAALPSRARPVEDARRLDNRRSVTQQPSRPNQVQRAANRAAAPVHQPRPAQRSVPMPAPKPVASKPAHTPKAVAKSHRPSAQNAQPATRSERRQPR